MKKSVECVLATLPFWRRSVESQYGKYHPVEKGKAHLWCKDIRIRFQVADEYLGRHRFASVGNRREPSSDAWDSDKGIQGPDWGAWASVLLGDKA
jgi:hypothetical protein